MRRIAFLVLLGLSTLAFADRVIRIPSAVKLRSQTARVELQWEGERPRNADLWLGYGLTREWEIELQVMRQSARDELASLNLTYQYLVPIPDAAPGIAVGVQDALNRTDGRKFFLVTTFRFGNYGRYNERTATEFTFGFAAGTRAGIFTGAMFPLTWQFRFLAEYDLIRPRAGFEYWTHQGFSARAIYDEQGPRWSVRYAVRF